MRTEALTGVKQTDYTPEENMVIGKLLKGKSLTEEEKHIWKNLGKEKKDLSDYK